MKVIWDQLIEPTKTHTDFKSKCNISAFNKKTNIFGLSFLLFWDCRSTKLVRLFSGNLPAMFSFSISIPMCVRRVNGGYLPAMFFLQLSGGQWAALFWLFSFWIEIMQISLVTETYRYSELFLSVLLVTREILKFN